MSAKNTRTPRPLIIIGPPGVGKTRCKQMHPGRFIDPEDSIDWKQMDLRHGLYPFEKIRETPLALFEHEIDWSAIWTEELLPRIYLAIQLRKDLVMGMVTPANAEAVSRFLAAYQDNAKLLLPEEARHYDLVSGDGARRPRTWGAEFRTWKNTFWSRLLLRGLAEEQALPIIRTVGRLPRKSQPNAFAQRQALDSQGRMFAETFFSRWAELDANGDIVAMYRGIALPDKSLELRCDRTAKVCGKNLHRCDAAVNLRHGTDDRPLAGWIASDKLRPVKRHQKTAVLFFTGTLAPFHVGHLDLLDKAKAFLESEGWNVIGGYASTFANRKTERIGPLYDLFGSVDHRNAMLQLGALHSDWLMADLPVQHLLHSQQLADGTHPCQSIATRLRQSGAIDSEAPVTTFWVNGADAYLDPDFFGQLATHADSDPLNRLRMLVIENRPGGNAWTKTNIARSVPQLSPYVLRTRQRMKKPTSATAVRNALLSGDRTALRRSIGLPLVESYLIGIAHKYVTMQ